VNHEKVAPDRIPALDGLRGFAIGTVLLFHYTYFRVGWVTISLFYVLSAYLITTRLLVLRSLPPTTYLSRFFMLRIARIFPLYFFALTVGTIGYAVLTWPVEWPRVFPYLATFSFNFYPIIEGDESPFVFCHFWSLATEEQFYLMWPFLVLLIPVRLLKSVALLFIITAPACRAVLGELLRGALPTELISRSIYYFPICHVDALGLGILLALGTLSGRIPVVEAGPQRSLPDLYRPFLLLLAGVFVAHIFVTTQFGHVGISRSLAIDYPERLYTTYHHVFTMSLTAIGSALLVYAALMRSNWATAIFERVWLRRLGIVSYGVYVFHLPLLEAFRFFTDIQPRTWLGLLFFFVYVVVSYGLAELSYRYFEEPIVKLARRGRSSSSP
jgi:peptidoglycan/LPS O-acetylase OafA/YrhL